MCRLASVHLLGGGGERSSSMSARNDRVDGRIWNFQGCNWAIHGEVNDLDVPLSHSPITYRGGSE